MIALIDGDILVYRVGFASQDVEVGFAMARMNTCIQEICEGVGTRDYKVYLTSEDKSNFRFEIYPEYKANRTQPKPIWYKELRAHLIADHGAEVIFGREADDALADAQNEDTVICSIDKDLDQVPGAHYDFVKRVAYEVDAKRAIRFFYYQLLTGDRTDNITGIEGIGPKKAAAILEGVEPTESALFQRVRDQYERKYSEDGSRLMLLNGRLLKIGGDVWEFPEVEGQEDFDPTLNESYQESLSEQN
jgi:DNA polymerase I